VSLEKSFGCHVDAASSIFPLGLNCPTSPSFEDRPQASAPKWPFICNFNRGGRGRERGLQYYLKMHNSLVADIAPDCARRMCACCLHLHVQGRTSQIGNRLCAVELLTTHRAPPQSHHIRCSGREWEWEWVVGCS